MGKKPHHKTVSLLWLGLRILLVMVILCAMILEGYTLIEQGEGSLPLPPRFGNFPANRAALENEPEKEVFQFAVVGDTRSVGTFETIVEELRGQSLDLGVLLGDCSYDGTPEEHRYFRAECAQEYALPFPVFYVVGNHDVDEETFPISRFETDYGPSVFSFEYQNCLFIMLRILGEPSDEESLAFLSELATLPEGRYRHKFVFMHKPPVMPTPQIEEFSKQERLVALFEQLGADYVFAGDFHGYFQVKLNDTNYVVTGGGGARLKKGYGKQFYHALVIRVSPEAVSERLVVVSGKHNLEDRLERLAIAEIWPRMERHPWASALLNAVILFVLVVLLKSFFRGTQSKDRAPGNLEQPDALGP